jgi:hypothetical protein
MGMRKSAEPKNQLARSFSEESTLLRKIASSFKRWALILKSKLHVKENHMKTIDWLSEPQEQPSPADYGYVHKDDVPDVSHCRDMLEGIIEAVYKTGDVAKLEDCLDELAAEFGIKLPETEVLVKSPKYAKKMLKGIIEAVYKTGDVDHLDENLDEVVRHFGLRLPKTEPVLGKRGSVQTDCTLESWLNFNKGYNKALMNKTTI